MEGYLHASGYTLGPIESSSKGYPTHSCIVHTHCQLARLMVVWPSRHDVCVNGKGLQRHQHWVDSHRTDWLWHISVRPTLQAYMHVHASLGHWYAITRWLGHVACVECGHWIWCAYFVLCNVRHCTYVLFCHCSYPCHLPQFHDQIGSLAAT